MFTVKTNQSPSCSWSGGSIRLIPGGMIGFLVVYLTLPDSMVNGKTYIENTGKNKRRCFCWAEPENNSSKIAEKVCHSGERTFHGHSDDKVVQEEGK